MRILATALLILAVACGALAADRSVLPDNPNAYKQPADWSTGLQGDDPVVDMVRATVYTNLTDFLAVIAPDYYFDDFSWCSWQTVYAPSYQFGPVNGYSYTASASSYLFSIPGAISTNSALDPITIVFDGAPVTAVGGDFFCTDFDGYPVPATTNVTLDDGTVVNLVYPTVFSGFTSLVPIVSMVITPSNDWATFDNFYVGSLNVTATEARSLSQVKALY
ncbi:MAG: hypothetical protein JW819_12395 [Candidatus Krumholzibacteriota bacterium]|nr:hypothetical protein [Candidatus Krumholzibacteriota bacterium]